MLAAFVGAVGAPIDAMSVINGQQIFLDLRGASDAGTATVTAAVRGSTATDKIISVPIEEGQIPSATSHTQTLMLVTGETASTRAVAFVEWGATGAGGGGVNDEGGHRTGAGGGDSNQGGDLAGTHGGERNATARGGVVLASTGGAGMGVMNGLACTMSAAGAMVLVPRWHTQEHGGTQAHE